MVDCLIGQRFGKTGRQSVAHQKRPAIIYYAEEIFRDINSVIRDDKQLSRNILPRSRVALPMPPPPTDQEILEMLRLKKNISPRGSTAITRPHGPELKEEKRALRGIRKKKHESSSSIIRDNVPFCCYV